MMRRLIALLAALAAFPGATPLAIAADLPVKAAPIAAPMPAPNWTGFYIGGHFGYGWNLSGTTIRDQTTLAGAVADIGGAPHGLVGGVHAGYDVEVGNKLVLGIFAEGSIADLSGTGAISAAGTNLLTVNSATNYMGIFGGRIGTTWLGDHVLLFGEGGLGWGGAKPNFQVAGLQQAANDTSVGWAVGGGIGVKLDRHWEAVAKLDYYHLGDKSLTAQVAGGPVLATATTPYNFATATLGLNYRF